MAFPELHFFPANDINGSTILELPITNEYVERVAIRMALREVGSMDLRFSRQLAETLADSDAFVADTFVRLLVPAVSTTRYFGGGFLGDQTRQLIARVAAGEDISITLLGPAWYLSRAILWDEQFSVDASHPYRIDLVNGVFRFEGDADAGNVLKRLQREDNNNTIAEFIPDMTITFDHDVDSNGDAWADAVGSDDEPFELPIGQTFLDDTFAVLAAVPSLDMTWDIGTVATPKLEMSVWQGLTGYARDLVPSGASDFSSGVVHFKKGVNVVSDFVFRAAGRRKATHALAIGSDGKYGRAVRATYSPGGYARATSIDRGNLHWEPALDRAAQRFLAHQQLGEQEITLAHFPGFAPTSGLYMPGPHSTNGHYWLGDSIGVTTAPGTPDVVDLVAASELVTAVTMDLATVAKDGTATEGALSWNVVAELNIERSSPSAPSEAGSGSSGGILLCAHAATVVETSSAWKIYLGGSPPAGFKDPGYDDSALSNAVNVSNGGGPWYDFGSSRWIWQDEATGTPPAQPSGEERSFRTEFTLTTVPTIAELTVAADNGCLVYINGTLVASHGAGERGAPDAVPHNYDNPQTITVSPSVFVVGANCISIIGWNETVAAPGPAAVYAALALGDTSESARAAPCDHGHGAADIVYGNSGSGLDAKNVQDAIDELAASPGGGAMVVQEDDVTKAAAATTLDFGHGLDVTESPSGEANVAVDETELDVIQASLLDAKGDVIVATADNTPSRLGVGSDNKVLTADSTAGPGVAWKLISDIPAATNIGWIDSSTNPDKPPASPNSEDDEFDAGSLAGKWTRTNTPNDQLFADSCLVVAPTNANSTYYGQSYSPGASTAFTITAKFKGLLFLEATDFAGISAYGAGGISSPVAELDLRWTSSGIFRIHSDVPTASQDIAIPFALGGGTIYLKMSRDASNVWTYKFSLDGLAYTAFSFATRTDSTTITGIGFRFGQTGTRTDKYMGIDWFRRT